tara:strand:+ start:16 stop:870 length:855 start_codon:yes stop_codon:yes gene_type:complete
MIIWIASYPKSGNTWLRSLLASYYYSKKGEFDFKLLERIKLFPKVEDFINDPDAYPTLESTSKNWISKQMEINNDQKLKFFKTHNAICNINGNSFTDAKNSLGGIYIVRDPRNIITSIANHYQININEALEFMNNERRYLYQKIGTRYLAFSPLFSWSQHVESWTSCKLFPVLVIRYEDLHSATFQTFQKVINFIKDISKNQISFDREKAKRSINSCDFDKLKNLEKKEGFKEAMIKKDKSGTISFFNLGKDNDYRKLLHTKILEKINNLYKDKLFEFNYEKRN